MHSVPWPLRCEVNRVPYTIRGAINHRVYDNYICGRNIWKIRCHVMLGHKRVASPCTFRHGCWCVMPWVQRAFIVSILVSKTSALHRRFTEVANGWYDSLLTNNLMMASWYGNAFRITCPFWGESISHCNFLVENISNDFAEVKRNKRKTIDDYLKVWYQIPQLQHNDIWRFLFLLESSHRNNIITWCQSDSLALEFARDLHLNLESKVLQKRTRYWFR